MKRSGTAIIFVIVWTAVLLASYGIGLYIREVRFRHAKIESRIAAQPQMSSQIQKPSDTGESAIEPAEMVQAPPDIRPMPDGEDREDFPAFPPEESGRLTEEKGKVKERREKKPTEQKEKLKAQMREMFGEKEKGAKKEYPKLSDEEKARLKEQWRTVKKGMKKGWETMSEEESEQLRG